MESLHLLAALVQIQGYILLAGCIELMRLIFLIEEGAGLVFTASIIDRYCAMFLFGQCHGGHEQDGFCNYFPDDSRRGVVQ
jgi:hypothetical protein